MMVRNNGFLGFRLSNEDPTPLGGATIEVTGHDGKRQLGPVCQGVAPVIGKTFAQNSIYF
jgi:hypothetical protein